MTFHNRFDPLSEETDAVQAPSRPEQFVMTEGSDTESCELVVRPSRRLTLRWNPSAPDDGECVARVRGAINQERRQRQVLDAEVFITRVCERWVRSTERRVPLMWSAADRNRGCAVLLWLTATAQQVPSLCVAGEEVTGRDSSRRHAQSGHHVQSRSLRVDPQPRLSTSSLGCPF